MNPIVTPESNPADIGEPVHRLELTQCQCGEIALSLQVELVFGVIIHERRSPAGMLTGNVMSPVLVFMYDGANELTYK